MNIENGIYYHVHRRCSAEGEWVVGDTIEFNQEIYNNFFGFYIHRNMKKTDYSIDINEKIKEYTMLIRELVYEEVRFKWFSDLPSRRHCIWLCDQTQLDYWQNTLGGECDIYKVKVSGNMHACYAGALDDDNMNYQILSEKALSYWTGECVGNPIEKEYLFEGKVELIEKL